MSKKASRRGPESRDLRRATIQAKRSAAGSERSKAGYEDVKTCAVCGGRLLLSESVQWNTDSASGARTGVHIGCKGEGSS